MINMPYLYLKITKKKIETLFVYIKPSVLSYFLFILITFLALPAPQILKNRFFYQKSFSKLHLIHFNASKSLHFVTNSQNLTLFHLHHLKQAIL